MTEFPSRERERGEERETGEKKGEVLLPPLLATEIPSRDRERGGERETGEKREESLRERRARGRER